MKYSVVRQYIISWGLIGTITIVSYFSVDYIGYRVVALVLLLVVSILAMLFDILPVLTASILSALAWNFFFIPPTFTFYIGTTEDALMFLMYFAIALINAVLTFKIREFEKNARDKEEREKTIQLYNTLLSSLSHELRTPISTIIGAIDTLKESEAKLSGRDKNDLLAEIEIAGLRLNRQVENLLNMSRLEAGILKPKLDWCDVNELMHTVIKINEKDSIQHNIIFNPREELPLFKIDRILTEQILHNLLHNALQYTPKNSTIFIDISQKNHNCLFIIEDNGPGFPENELASVFNKFYRLPQSITGGTGLGLSIAKGFTEVLNGCIKLENLKSGGARFSISMPAESSPINQPGYE